MELRGRVFGLDHSETLVAADSLANAYRDAGQYEDAGAVAR